MTKTRNLLILLLLAGLLMLALAAIGNAKPKPVASPPATSKIILIAKHAAAAKGWVGYQWTALNTVVTRESSWNPCRHYPSTTNCVYAGTNACGIPQRSPCPAAWRGRLGATWRLQIAELLRYVEGRYTTPQAALDYWNRWKRY